MADKYRPPYSGGLAIRITKEQGNYIRDNYRNMTAKEIALHLGLTDKQVIGWANNHNVTKGRSRLFRDDELEFIEQNYLTMSYRQIANILGYSERQVRGWINNNLPKKSRTFNNQYFDKIDTPDRAYWLGFIYADGWISSHKRRDQNTLCYEFGMELQRGDEYMLQLLNDAIGGVHIIKRYHNEKYICGNESVSVTDSSILRVYSKGIVDGLFKNGIDFNKTLSNRFPVVPDALFLDFLRGYIDGDGCIHEMKPKCLAVHITSANKDCLTYIQNKLLELYDVHSSLYTETERKHRLYCFRHDDVKRLLDMIYSSNDCIKLIRKFEKYTSFYGLAA